MINSGEFNVQNFQSLIENYEAALRDVAEDLDTVQTEQKAIRETLNENYQLSQEVKRIAGEKANLETAHTFQENELIENLKLQLKLVTEEKEQATKLWQNAADAVEHLEEEIRIYQENTEGFVPKSKLTGLKKSYEEKLNELQATVVQTKTKLEETIHLKSKELLNKDKEIVGTIQHHDNTFKIIKNLEDEVLTLQHRLNNSNAEKHQLEKDIKGKNEEIEFLKTKVKECTIKVEEALQVVEAAFNEKDAALMREATAKEETVKLSQTLTDFIDETDGKIKSIKQDHESKLQKMRQTLQTSQELIRIKESEIETCTKKCSLLEMEVEKIRNSHNYTDDGGTSKMLILEKNLENTFQQLLLSEKQNIQLKGEVQSIKNDLDQMAHHYERDISSREAEKIVLKNEIKMLKIELDQSHLKVSQSKEAINNLKDKISTMEMHFKEQIKETKDSFQQTCIDRQEMESVHNQIVQELQEQLYSQTEINKKWRAETKNMTEQLEKVINELKMVNTKIKQENRVLNERLKEANVKMFEYRKFLEMISQDVSKITTMTLPEINTYES